MSIDIWEGHILREHGDLDGFTENLIENIPQLTTAYDSLGYSTTFDKDFCMLKVQKDLVHAGFNPLVINGGTAEWKHIGNDGSVFFPVNWLDQIPRMFYTAKVFTAGLRFEYALKTKVSMLNPEWSTPRAKDTEAVLYLKNKLIAENITDEDVYKWFWSYNPFWYKRGYDKFFRPAVAWPLEQS